MNDFGTIVLGACAKCGQPITGNCSINSGDGKTYHPDCYPSQSIPVAYVEPVDYARIRQIIREEVSAALARKDALLRQAMEAQQALIEWDKARDFQVPYKVRDPLHAAIAAITKELEQK